MNIFLTQDEQDNLKFQCGDKTNTFPITMEAIKKFKLIKVLNNGDVAMCTENSSLNVIVDPKIYTKIFGEVEMRMIQNAKDKISKIDSIVPDHLKDKYCLIFGGKVFDYADTWEEIEKIREEKYPGLLMTTFMPISKKL
ncbi:MAG: hypothetical protein M1338_00020 [Patescibacteria group bacterium]|nr:hypothetical protein [Patescibacteria group bacterium]